MTGKKQSKKINEATPELLLSDMELTKEMKVLLDEWLVNGEHKEEVVAALKKLFNQKSSESCDPRMLERIFTGIKAKTGIDFRQSEKKTIFPRIIFRVAAVLLPLFILGGAIAMWVNRGEKLLPETSGQIMLSTATDNERKEVTLPDHSKVWLGKNSSIDYPEDFFTERKVTLNGEAYFSVTRYEGKTFEVITNDIHIQVLGTEFFVRTDKQGETEVALASGKIAVTDRANRNCVHELFPREQLILNNTTRKVEKKEVELASIHMHKFNVLHALEELPLRKVFARLASFHGIEIRIDESLPHDTVIGFDFEPEATLEDVLETIRFVSKEVFDYEIKEKQVTITHRKKQ